MVSPCPVIPNKSLDRLTSIPSPRLCEPSKTARQSILSYDTPTRVVPSGLLHCARNDAREVDWYGVPLPHHSEQIAGSPNRNSLTPSLRAVADGTAIHSFLRHSNPHCLLWIASRHDPLALAMTREAAGNNRVRRHITCASQSVSNLRWLSFPEARL